MTDPRFTFIEFNERRRARGAEAARVEVDYGTGSGLLWMSERDIRRNIMTFGPCAELDKALAAYTGTVRGPALIDPATVSAQLVAMLEPELRTFEGKGHE